MGYYIVLRDITEYSTIYSSKSGLITPWWHFEGNSNTPSFTPLDFLDRLLQFEFQPIHEEEELARRTGLGNFCFLTYRADTPDKRWPKKDGVEYMSNPTDLEIFTYIGKRELLKSGDNKNYTATVDDYDAWARWEASPRNAYEISFVETFKHPDSDRWLDWRNEKYPQAGTGYQDTYGDVPVEWGNNTILPQFQKNIEDKRLDGMGEKTNQVLYDYKGFKVFTFCQLVYFLQNPDEHGGYPKGYYYGVKGDANCGDTGPGHWTGIVVK